MIAAVILGTLLFITALALHLSMLRLARRIAPPGEPRTLVQTMGFHIFEQLVVLASHLLVALLFAACLFLAVEVGLEGFAKEPSMGWMDYYYYSLINVTGIESLTGFMIISCTAQFVYKCMSAKTPESTTWDGVKPTR